jgi:iron(III) transport system substrate-binding protein
MNRRHFLGAAGITALGAGCNSDRNRVVLYCAQDREFAEAILSAFTNRTGIQVSVKYDSEADKSVGLVEELLRERNRPRCDVFWNNEILGTHRLRRAGALAEYSSPSANNFPEWTKSATYQMFAARARVFLVNRKLLGKAEPPQSLMELTKQQWRGRVAMARPYFGTTATNAACLFASLGDERAERLFRDLKDNAIRVVSGNKQSAQAVSRGEVTVGWTDTDDAIIEVEARHPVEIVYPDRTKGESNPELGTLFIPNTIGLIQRGPNAEAAKRLIDFLLSAEIEAELAKNASRQIPLNPAVKADLPASILRPEQVHSMPIQVEAVVDVWDRSQTALRQIFGE